MEFDSLRAFQVDIKSEFAMIWIILIVFSTTILYFYLTWNYNYWNNRGIIGPQPRPIVGTFPKSAVYLRNFVYELDDIYR